MKTRMTLDEAKSLPKVFTDMNKLDQQYFTPTGRELKTCRHCTYGLFWAWGYECDDQFCSIGGFQITLNGKCKLYKSLYSKRKK